MLEAQENELAVQKVATRHSHMMGLGGTEVYPYLEELAHEGGFEDSLKNLPIKRKSYYVNLNRVLGAVCLYKNDRFRWMDPYKAEYFCSTAPGYEETMPEELLTIVQDEATGVVSLTSSLGQVRNGSFANL